VTNSDGISFADYQEYRRDILENGCRSYDVSADVETVLDDIRQCSQNRFEELKMLETYLSGLEYSTNCGALPDTVTDAASFLDYFLFQSQKGYCMHFATAFVLMANEMGIPCRYVQGYLAEKGDDGNILVRQSNAHAWAEAYIDHVGWICFEPTPGFSGSAGWGINARDLTDFDYHRSEHVHSEEQDAQEETPEQTEQDSGAADPMIFVLPTLGVIGFLLLCWVISRAAVRRRYLRMGCTEKYRSLTQQNLRLLGYLGFRMDEGETYTEYVNRIMQSGRDELKEHLSFIPLYEMVLYSDKEITSEEVAAGEQVCRILREMAKKSRLKYRLLLLFR